MMEKEEIRSILIKILDAESVHWDIPSNSDWENLEKRFYTKFPKEFIYLMDLLAEYVFPGDILNVKESGNTNGCYERNNGFKYYCGNRFLSKQNK